MTLQPAYETVLRIGDHAVTLRASLRAAIAIDNLPGGFAGAYQGLLTQSLSTIRAVLLAAAPDRQEAERFLSATADKPLSPFLVEAQAACLAVMAALIKAGEDSADEAPSQGSEPGAAMPLREYFQSLFRYATGWLGWTPANTWMASPAEIETAFAAHVDRLVKMTPGASTSATSTSNPDHYTPERLKKIEEQGFDPAFDRAGLRNLKAKT